MSAIIPIPKIPISVRPGTMDDLPFIDGLQKMNTKQVGWMPTKQLEGKIAKGHVIVAEEPSPLPSPCVQGEGDRRVGYCIGHDQYFKRDDVGIIYQMNVAPERRRSLVGATLLKAMFDRAAYGCRLFCCWCAQDIEANRFWESMGFIPLAFRAGSREKGRVHIFWQRRIRAGDETTPYWFPAQTSSGSIREDRLVLPIPPGKNWWDPMPRVLPSGELPVEEPRRLLGTKARAVKDCAKAPSLETLPGLRFSIPEPPAAVKQKSKRQRKVVKNDPKLVAAARELRDRWLEEVNSGAYLPEAHGKYEISRQMGRTATGTSKAIAADKIIPALPAPMAA